MKIVIITLFATLIFTAAAPTKPASTQSVTTSKPPVDWHFIKEMSDLGIGYTSLTLRSDSKVHKQFLNGLQNSAELDN